MQGQFCLFRKAKYAVVQCCSLGLFGSVCYRTCMSAPTRTFRQERSYLQKMNWDVQLPYSQCLHTQCVPPRQCMHACATTCEPQVASMAGHASTGVPCTEPSYTQAMHTAQALHNAQALPCMPIWAGPGSRYDKQALLGMHQGVTATWQTHLPAASIM